MLTVRRRLIATSATALALALPASAQADLTLTAETIPQAGFALVGRDASAEANGLTVTQDPTTQAWQITDTAGISATVPGQCTVVSPTQASCAAAGFDFVEFDLGAGSDVAQATGPYKAIGPKEKGLVDLVATLGGGNDTFTGGGGSNGVLGAKGRTIKEIGTSARAEIGAMVGAPVHLFLFVKVRERWAEDPERYREMGLDYPKR